MQFATIKKAAFALVPTRQECKTMVVGALVLGAGVAMADSTIDLAPINKAIETITAIGTLVFGIYAGIKTYKWARAAMG